MPRNFWRIAIVTRVSRSRDSETKKTFPAEYTHHDTNQTDKGREQKLRPEATVIDQLKRKYACKLHEHWEGGRIFEHCKYQSFS